MNQLKTWHISIALMFVLIAALLFFSSSIVGAVVLLSMFPAVFWTGYTWHERRIWVEAETERKILEKYRASRKTPI